MNERVDERQAAATTGQARSVDPAEFDPLGGAGLASGGPALIWALQRSAGNRAVARHLAKANFGARRVPARLLQRFQAVPTVRFSVKVDRVMDARELLVEFAVQTRQAEGLTREQAEQGIAAGQIYWVDKDGNAIPIDQGPTATLKDLRNGYKLITIFALSVEPMSRGAIAQRGREFHALSAEAKTEINKQTDELFWRLTGYKVGQKLDPKRNAHDRLLAQDWLRLRAQIVEQRAQYLAQPGDLRRQLWELIPDEARPFLFAEGGKAELLPKDFETALRVAMQIAALTPAERSEYASRVTGTSTNWRAFEESLERFAAERRERKETAEERRLIENRLFGLDAIYGRYRRYLSMLTSNARLGGLGASDPRAAGTALGSQPALTRMRSELNADLVTAGFPGGLDEFELVIRQYEAVFDRETRAVAKVLLDQYEHVLLREEERYRKGDATKKLFTALAATSARAEYETAEKIREEHATGVVLTPEEMADQAYWVGQRREALGRAEAAVGTVVKEHPLVGERKFDREALARASETEVGGRMLAYIAARQADIAKTRAKLAENPRMIYGLDTLLETSKTAQGIEPGTLLDRIIRDHISDENWTDVIPDFVLAIIAIAAGLLTGGGGTLAVLAAGTALGIGAYQAVEEFKRYETRMAASGARLASTDPSLAWVIVAVIGAGFDAAALFKALPAIRPAIKAFDAGAEAGDVAALSNRLEGVEEGIRKSIVQAASAELEARAAWRSILRPPAALRSVVVPLAEEFGRFVYAVYLTVKRGIRDLRVFVKTNEAIELIGDAAKLSGEELALLKQGYMRAVAEMEAIAARGKALGIADKDVADLLKLRAETKGMTGEALIEEMELISAAKGPGLTVELTEKQWARLRRVREALNDETKWVNVTAKDRWRLGRVYDKLLEQLVSEGVKRTGQQVLHYSELTADLVKQLRKSGKRVLLTEARIPSKGLRLDMIEIDFAKGRAELLDITATPSKVHVDKTRSGKEALEELLGMPVDAKELYYTGPKGELLEDLVEVPVR